MSNENDIRRLLKRKLQAQRDQPPSPGGDTEAARRLGEFLSERCAEKGWSAHDLAHSLQIEDELASAVLEGTLPRSEIDDGFLTDLANALDCELGELKRILE